MGDFCDAFIGVVPQAINAVQPFRMCDPGQFNQNTLINVNALQQLVAKAGSDPSINLNTFVPTGVANNTVRFIVNGFTAQKIFGTPFGNAPRNINTDAITNTANLSVFKRVKINERASFEFHATLLNVLNHANF